MVVDRCEKTLRSIFGNNIKIYESDAKGNYKYTIVYKGQRIVEITFFNKEKTIYKYEVDFKLVEMLLFKSKIKVDDAILIAPKFNFYLSEYIGRKYLNRPDIEPTDQIKIIEYDGSPLAINLNTIQSAFITDEEFVNEINPEEDQYEFVKRTVLTLVSDSGVYSFFIDRNVLKDSLLMSGIVSAIIKKAKKSNNSMDYIVDI